MHSSSTAEQPPLQGRIDTHSHVVPPMYRKWLEGNRGYRGPYVDWDREAAADYLDRNGIATAIMSTSAPGLWIPGGDDRGQARALARGINEFCAEVVRDDPAHFGFFATLTLPDVDGCIAEATYAFNELRADGVVLMTNTDGRYLGSPEWDPLLEFLDQHHAVVFVHPTAPPGPPVPGISPGVADFLADSVRAAVNLVKKDCLSRFPNITFVLSHGGGYLPYAALRIARMALPETPQDDALAQLRRFYFDTALTSGPYALPALLSFAHPDHLVFGSDWPYASIADAVAFTERLDAYPASASQKHAINRGNAELLFPRFASAPARAMHDLARAASPPSE